MSTKQAELDPRLPTELEKEIFELAAEACLPSIPGLLLVAHRVKVWIEPILYRTFIVSETEKYDYHAHPTTITLENFLQLLDSRPDSFFHCHVRHLLCDNIDTDDTEKILTKCSGAKDIFLHGCATDPTLLPLLAAIDVTVTFADWLPWAGLATLPCLTHLAFFSVDSCGFLADALAHCTRLSVLIVLWSEDRGKAQGMDEQLSAVFAHDSRFVQVMVGDFLKDWEAGAVSGEDYWSRAEAIVQDRRLRKTQFILVCQLVPPAIPSFRATWHLVHAVLFLCDLDAGGVER
ncbi:hypothetical protein C8R43DRAFT_1239321 [Mycena crocata]|nr:hypothetical protein C8R43DRAFT_1239321 [Mycena crocata]